MFPLIWLLTSLIVLPRSRFARRADTIPTVCRFSLSISADPGSKFIVARLLNGLSVPFGKIGKRYELAYSTDLKNHGSIMVSLFYRQNLHDIQPFIVYYPSFLVGDTTYTDVAVSTRENIGKENNIGLTLFCSVKLFSKLDLRSNLFFYERHTINQIDKGYNYNSFNYRINFNGDYQFSKTL